MNNRLLPMPADRWLGPPSVLPSMEVVADALSSATLQNFNAVSRTAGRASLRRIYHSILTNAGAGRVGCNDLGRWVRNSRRLAGDGTIEHCCISALQGGTLAVRLGADVSALTNRLLQHRRGAAEPSAYPERYRVGTTPRNPNRTLDTFLSVFGTAGGRCHCWLASITVYMYAF